MAGIGFSFFEFFVLVGARVLRLLLPPCCVDMCDPEMLIKEGVGIVC